MQKLKNLSIKITQQQQEPKKEEKKKDDNTIDAEFEDVTPEPEVDKQD